MTTRIALFDCPHCIDEFRFDYQRIAKLTYGWRVRVRCPGCGNIVEVVMLAYTLIHGCDLTVTYRDGKNRMYSTSQVPIKYTNFNVRIIKITSGFN